ncbi:hypothetical protein [Roseicyclus marinus]|uniref:hypothetical protein n=1 Tax=Roseicyclus marinus TaxID=2161673 RepID=UPI00240ED777|nr:hypothetical protein [Roseicyclus marinus]MDG3040910.1 hypothetical protein [Roseicyclus marinus]
MFRSLILSVALCLPGAAKAQSCTLDFTITVTQGVGTTRPGTSLSGEAEFTLTGRTFPGEGGAAVHLAQGEMRLGPDIRGEVWALVTTSGNPVADLLAVHARNVTGMDFAGIAYRGPMTISLYGHPGSLPEALVPTDQAAWDAMDLRRSFALHAQGYDRLGGDIASLTLACDTPVPIDSAVESAYPARQ